MKQYLVRVTILLVTACFCLAGFGQIALADITTALAADPQEHAALKLLGDAERKCEHHQWQSAAEDAEKLVRERNEWDRAPWAQFMLARALSGAGEHEQAIQMCTNLRDSYKLTDPLLAASAQYTIGASLQRGRVQAYWEVEQFLNSLVELQPLWRSRFMAGFLLEQMLKSPRFDASEPGSLGAKMKDRLQLDAPEKDIEAWVLGTMCAWNARQNRLELADQQYAQLRKLLPEDDRRIALACASMAAGKAHRIRYDDEMGVLSQAEQLVAELETFFPAEEWLIAKSKLSIVEAMLRMKKRISDAERYLLEITTSNTNSDLQPQALTRLSIVLYEQARFSDAAAAAQMVGERYPYSSWSDYAAFCRADSLAKAGKKEDARYAFSKVIELYADSDWALLATSKLEVLSK